MLAELHILIASHSEPHTITKPARHLSDSRGKVLRRPSLGRSISSGGIKSEKGQRLVAATLQGFLARFRSPCFLEGVDLFVADEKLRRNRFGIRSHGACQVEIIVNLVGCGVISDALSSFVKGIR